MKKLSLSVATVLASTAARELAHTGIEIDYTATGNTKGVSQ